jgi:hypothetical protein
MPNYIANTIHNLTVIRLASDGSVTLAPILYWIDLQDKLIPVDLTRMTIAWQRLLGPDLAIHDDVSRCVYLRNGSGFETLEAFKEENK